MTEFRAGLFPRPEYFAERRNADGTVRFYWQATARLAALLVGSPHGPVVRLPADRAAAEEECRAITARVNAFLVAATAPTRPTATATPAAAAHPGAKMALRNVEGTLAHAIADYKLSKAYAGVERRTKKQYDWMLGMVEDWGGGLRISGVTYERVMAAADRLADKPRSQQLFLTLLAMVIDRTARKKAAPGEIVANPVRLVLMEIDKPEPAGGWIWPRYTVAHFAACADALGWHSVGTAVILNEWLAQRTGDVLALPRSAYRDGVLHVVQSKTGQYAPIPLDLVAPLRQRLEWQFREEAKGTVQNLTPRTLLTCEDTREPWKLDWFRAVFHRIRSAMAGAEDAKAADTETLAKAELWPVGGFVLDAVPRRLWRDMAKGLDGMPVVRAVDLKFSHLRHTGITRLRQAGCSDDEIRAISGHTQPATVYKHYMAVTIESAGNAFTRRTEFEAAGR